MLIIVSGFQRCGSSLMLQMLSAAGVRVYHDTSMGYPAFESQKQVTAADDPSWLIPLDGCALKWLEPLRQLPPVGLPLDVRVLWMTRDHKQQAKSAIKFLTLVGGLSVPGGAARAMAASYRVDESRARAAWATWGAAVKVVPFEKLLSDPHKMALSISLWLDRPLDTTAMAREVRQRGPDCLPGLLELELLASR